MKTLLLILTIALASCTPKLEIVQKPSPSSNRFEVIQLGNMRRDQYLVDKETGQMWTPICLIDSKTRNAADCAYSAWMKVDAEDINMKRSEIYAFVESVKAK